ncbi:hypothetical protein H2202_011174 [Exophiala xenobiotica]|nr:hypothetical protein H2202_011174 [Exophiala xenobiotica]
MDGRHERSNSYAQPLPPPQGAGIPPPTPAWNPVHSPYSDPSEHRPPPPDLVHQQPYPPPGQSYSHPPPPPPGREPPGHAYDPGYGRPGGVSCPSRSPRDPYRPPYHPVSTPHESSYCQPPLDYRQRHAQSTPESQPNGTYQPFHVVTGHEMMHAQTRRPPGPYGPPSAGPHPSAGPYVQPAYFDPNYQQRRKPVRAAQACDSCRQRKAKCDEGRPECQHCKANGLKCTYRETLPQKTEKQMLTITDKLETMTGNIEMLIQQQKTQRDKSQKQTEQISMLLTALQKNAGSGDVGAAATPDEQMGFAKRLKKRIRRINRKA